MSEIFREVEVRGEGVRGEGVRGERYVLEVEVFVYELQAAVGILSPLTPHLFFSKIPLTPHPFFSNYPLTSISTFSPLPYAAVISFMRRVMAARELHKMPQCLFQPTKIQPCVSSG